MMSLSHARLPVSLVFVLLWSSGYIAAKYALQHTGIFTLLFLRYAMLSLILSSFVLIVHGRHPISWFALRQCMLIGVLAHALYLATLCAAFSLGATPGTASLVGGFQPLLTGLLAARSLGEHHRLRQWLGLFVGLAAILLIALHDVSLGARLTSYGLLIIGVACITIAAVHQRWLDTACEHERVPLSVNLFVQCTVSAAALFMPAALLEGFAVEWCVEFELSLLWLALGVSLGGYGTYWLLLQHCQATQVASLTYLTVPVTLLLGYLVFGDELRPLDLLGLTMGVIAVVLVHRHASSPSTAGI